MLNVNRMKGILGDAVSNDVRTLELRVGQVVRGVVLQQYPNNEATVSINGVHVRAKLEVPIMEGQASLLQVQPDSKGGQVHLKQVDPTTIGLQDPMKDILKALNLPDKPWANELVKDLRKEGFALNKETAAAFQRAAQLAPAGVNQEQWMQAAATVFKRGLPMSEATISAIHQLQSGAPAHQLLGQLRRLLSVPSSSASPATNAIILQLASLLEDGAELIRQLPAQSAGTGQLQQGNNLQTSNQAPTQQQTGVGSQAASQQQGVVGSQEATQQQSVVGNQAATQQQGGAGSQAGAQQPSGVVNQVGIQQPNAVGSQSGVQQQGAVLPASASAEQTQQASAIRQPSESNALNGQASTAAQPQGPAGQLSVTANQSGMHAPGSGSSLLPQLLKWLGVNYEATLGKQLMQQQGTTAAQMAQRAEQTSLQQAHNSMPQPSQSGAQTAAQPPSQLASAAMPMAANTQSVANAAQLMQQASADQVASSNTQQGAQPQVSAQGQVTALPTHQTDTAAIAALTQQQSQSHATQLNLQQASVSGQQQELSQVQQQAPPANQQQLHQPSHDNLKSAIIQLLGQPDVSGQVKETAQQLLHAITGQQLMLTAERNHSLFSHITMFIPIKDSNNGQTAAVHIQTRRDRRGELDSENCRIVFDLQMKALGPTLVDMSIVNKIVSLNLWNDHPAVAPIVESLKPEISEALYDHGYMLSSVRATPVPIKEAEAVKPEEGRTVIIPPDIDQLSSTRYKGVDFKV